MINIIYERKFTTKTHGYADKSFDMQEFIAIAKKNRSLIHVIADGGEGKTEFVERVLKQNLSVYKFYNQKNILGFKICDHIVIDGWDEIPMYIRREVRNSIIKSNAKGILIIGRDDNQMLSVYSSCVYMMTTKIEGTDLPPRFYGWAKGMDIDLSVNSKTKYSRICEITRRHYEEQKLSTLSVSFLSFLTYKMLRKGSIMINEKHVDKDLKAFNERNKSNLSKENISGVAPIENGWLYFDNRSLFFYFCTRFIKEMALKSPEILMGLYHPIFKMEEYKELSLFLSYSGSDVITSLFDVNLYGVFSEFYFSKALMSLEGIVKNEKIFDYYIAYNEKNNWEKPVNQYLDDVFANIIRKDKRFIKGVKEEILFRKSSLMIPLLKKNTEIDDVSFNEIWKYCLRTKGNIYYFMDVLRVARKKDITNLCLQFIHSFPALKNEKYLFEWMSNNEKGDLTLFIKETGHYFNHDFDFIKSSNYSYACLFNVPYTARFLLTIPAIESYEVDKKIVSDKNYFLSVYELKGFDVLKKECLYLAKLSENDKLLESEFLSSITSILKYLKEDESNELLEKKLAINYNYSAEKDIVLVLTEIFNYDYKPQRGRLQGETLSKKQIDQIKNNIDKFRPLFIKWEGKKKNSVKLDLYMQLCSLLKIRVEQGFIIDNFKWASRALNQKNSPMASRALTEWIDWTKDYDWYEIQSTMVDSWCGDEREIQNNKHYLSEIFYDYFIKCKWTRWDIDIFLERNNFVSPIIKFLTDNRELLNSSDKVKVHNWWMGYKLISSPSRSHEIEFLESIPAKYKAGIEIEELIETITDNDAIDIVKVLITNISKLGINDYEHGLRSTLPIEELLEVPNIVFHFVIKLLAIRELNYNIDNIKLLSIDDTLARGNMLITLLFEICNSVGADFGKTVSYEKGSSLDANFLVLLRHAEVSNKYDGFINKYYNYLNSEMTPKDFKRIVTEEIIPRINSLVSEWDFPGETELQKKLAGTISNDVYEEYRIKADFEFNPYTKDASSKSVDISFSFDDMCIFIEIKDYDDSRLSTQEIHDQLNSYNNENLFTISKILYIFRKKTFSRKISEDTKNKIRNFYVASQTNNFEIVVHPIIREKVESVVKTR